MRSDWLEYEKSGDRSFDDYRDDDSARLDISVSRHWSRASDLSRSSQWATDQERRWDSDRITSARPAVFVAGIFSRTTFCRRLRRECVIRIQPWSNQSKTDRSRESRRREVAGGEPGPAGADRFSDHFRLGPRSAHFSGGRGVSSAAGGTRARHE